MPRHGELGALDGDASLDDVLVKGRSSIGTSIGSAARRSVNAARDKTPVPAAFDPNPVDADRDRRVQEGTTQERLLVPDLPDDLADKFRTVIEAMTPEERTAFESRRARSAEHYAKVVQRQREMRDVINAQRVMIEQTPPDFETIRPVFVHNMLADLVGMHDAMATMPEPDADMLDRVDQMRLAELRAAYARASEDERGFIADALAEAIYEMEGTDKDGKSWRSEVTSVRAGPATISVSGVIYSRDGARLASWSRDLDPKTGEVHHSSIQVVPSAQKKGVGSTFVKMSMHQAREAGFREVHLLAVNDADWNGVRTWPKLGFRLVGPLRSTAYFNEDEDRIREFEAQIGMSIEDLDTDDIIDFADLMGDIQLEGDMFLDLDDLPPGPPPHARPLHDKADPGSRNDRLTWDDWDRVLDGWRTVELEEPSNRSRTAFLGRKRTVKTPSRLAVKAGKPPIPVTFPGDRNPHFVCPPGTPRGGEWTDRLGTTCMLPHPEKLGRTIGDLADGPDRPASTPDLPDVPTPDAPRLDLPDDHPLVQHYVDEALRGGIPPRLPSGKPAPDDPRDAAVAFRAELATLLTGPSAEKLAVLQRHQSGSNKLPKVEFNPAYDPDFDVTVGRTPAELIAESLARDLYDMDGTSRDGMAWQARVVRTTGGDSGSVYITGVVTDNNGNEIGQFTRQLYIKNGIAYHTEFKLDGDQQEGGIGGAFVKESMHQARDAGFSKVDLHAVYVPDVYNGLVVWPHLGFKLTSPVTFDYGSDEERVLDALGIDDASEITEDMLIRYPEVFEEVYADAYMSLDLADLPADRPPHARALSRKAAKPQISWDDWDHWLDQLRDPYVKPDAVDRQRRARRRAKFAGRAFLHTKGKPPIPVVLPGNRNPNFICPPGTPRGGEWTDRLGTTCALPHPEKLGQTIRDLTDGPDQPGPQLATPDPDPRTKDGLMAVLRGSTRGKLTALRTLAGGRDRRDGLQSSADRESARRIGHSVARDLYNMSGVDANGRKWEARVESVDVTANGFLLSVNGKIYAPVNSDDDPDFDPDDPAWWEPIGYFSRTLYPSLGVAQHDVIRLDKDQRGTGIGTSHVMESMHRARDAGIERVELDALSQPATKFSPEWNGVSTWPMLGFEVMDDSVAIHMEDQRRSILYALGLSNVSEITADHIREHQDLFKGADASARMALDLENLPADRPPNIDRPAGKAAEPRPAVTWADWRRLLDEYFATMPDDYPDHIQPGRGRRVERKTFATLVATKTSRPPIPVTFPGNRNPNFICPPGTPRGGEWTDRLGTTCMIPHPEKLGQTIRDIADGPDRPLETLRTSDTSTVRRAATDAARVAAEPGSVRRQRSAEGLLERLRSELPRAEADLADRRERHATAVAAGDDESTIARLAQEIDDLAAEVGDYRRMLNVPDGPPPNEPPMNEPPTPDGKPPRFSRETISRLVQKVRENEGFTVNADNAEDTVSGYAVGIGTGEYSGVIDAKPFMEDDEFAIAEVEKWLEKHEDLLASDQVDHIGAWYDKEEGKVVLDPVQVVPDDGPYSPDPTEAWRARAEDRALELCRARDQRSMFHLDTFRTVWCGGSGGYADEATGRGEPIRLPMTLPDRVETMDRFFPPDRFANRSERSAAIEEFETRLKAVWYRWDGARGIRRAAWDIMGAEPTGIDPQIDRAQTTPDAPWVQNPDGWRDELADGGAEYFARYIYSRMLDEDRGGHDHGELYRGIRLTPEEALAMFGDPEAGIPGVVEEGKTFDMPPISFAERMTVGVLDLTEFYGTDMLLVVKGNPRAMRLMPMIGPTYDEGDEEAYLDYFLDPYQLENMWEQSGRADTFDSPEELQAAIDATIADIEAAYEEYKQATYRELDLVRGQKLGMALAEKLLDAGAMREEIILAGMPNPNGLQSWDEEEFIPHEVLTGGRFYVRSIYPDPRGKYGKIVEVEQVGVVDPGTGKMVDTTDISKHVKGFATWLIDLL